MGDSHKGETWLAETRQHARPGDGCKRRDVRWPLGRRLTVALPLDVVGESHRQRSKLHVRTAAKSRILDRMTASPEQAIQRRRVGTSQIRRESKRNMQRGRRRDYGLYRRVVGTHVGRPSTNIDRRAPDVLDHAQLDEPSAHGILLRVTHVGRPDRRQRRTCHPAQDPSRYGRQFVRAGGKGSHTDAEIRRRRYYGRLRRPPGSPPISRREPVIRCDAPATTSQVTGPGRASPVPAVTI